MLFYSCLKVFGNILINLGIYIFIFALHSTLHATCLSALIITTSGSINLHATCFERRHQDQNDTAAILKIKESFQQDAKLFQTKDTDPGTGSGAEFDFISWATSLLHDLNYFHDRHLLIGCLLLAELTTMQLYWTRIEFKL